jgi:hypothetical protein
MINHIENARRLRPIIERAMQSVDGQDALDAVGLYPAWEKLCETAFVAEKTGFKFSHNGILYKTRQPGYTFVSHYVPGVGAESLFERIVETHPGTLDDPIPYDGNMALTAGLYYVQDGVMYLCNRDTGNPVYNALADLVGLYVAPVSEK